MFRFNGFRTDTSVSPALHAHAGTLGEHFDRGWHDGSATPEERRAARLILRRLWSRSRSDRSA